MASFSGKTVELPAAPAAVYERLSDFSRLDEQLDKVPADLRAKMGDVKFTRDSIVINAPAPAGEITMRITERIEPSKVVLSAASSPVPLQLVINIAPGAEADKSVVTPVAEVEIPAMLKPFVGPKMQEAADRFGDLLRTIFTGSRG